MLTQERLKELFDYGDGGLIRRSTGLRVKCSETNGHRYLRVFVDGKPRALHEVADTHNEELVVFKRVLPFFDARFMVDGSK